MNIWSVHGNGGSERRSQRTILGGVVHAAEDGSVNVRVDVNVLVSVDVVSLI